MLSMNCFTFKGSDWVIDFNGVDQIHVMYSFKHFFVCQLVESWYVIQCQTFLLGFFQLLGAPANPVTFQLSNAFEFVVEPNGDIRLSAFLSNGARRTLSVLAIDGRGERAQSTVTIDPLCSRGVSGPIEPLLNQFSPSNLIGFNPVSGGGVGGAGANPNQNSLLPGGFPGGFPAGMNPAVFSGPFPPMDGRFLPFGRENFTDQSLSNLFEQSWRVFQKFSFSEKKFRTISEFFSLITHPQSQHESLCSIDYTVHIQSPCRGKIWKKKSHVLNFLKGRCLLRIKSEEKEFKNIKKTKKNKEKKQRKKEK